MYLDKYEYADQIMEYYVTLAPGLENISKQEIERYGGKVVEMRENRGRIFFKGDLSIIPKVNYFSRTVERLNILLHREKILDISLDDIFSRVYNIDWTRWIKKDQNFAIRPLRIGDHDFTSIDIGRVAGDAVIKSYMNDKNVRLGVNLDDPDIIIRVELIFDELIIGIDTTGDVALDKRGYRVFNHPAHLNATIASSLIYLSKYSSDETLLDPMCGSGTIPIEGSLIMRNIPPGKFRERKYGFKFIDIFGFDLLNDLKSNHKENSDKYSIIGLDKNRRYLKGSEENAKNAGVLDTINFCCWDATKLHENFNELDVVIVNPPYGIRMGSKKFVKKLYNEFLDSARKIMHGNSRIISITAEDRAFKEAAIKNNFDIKHEFNVKFGGLLTKVFYITL